MYFESFKDDRLRQCGFSKDHKFQEVQVVLALIVTNEGMPLAYEVFPGNTFEGHTLIPTIEKMRTRFSIDRMIVVADAGMMTTENIHALNHERVRTIKPTQSIHVSVAENFMFA